MVSNFDVFQGIVVKLNTSSNYKINWPDLSQIGKKEAIFASCINSASVIGLGAIMCHASSLLKNILQKLMAFSATVDGYDCSKTHKKEQVCYRKKSFMEAFNTQQLLIISILEHWRAANNSIILSTQV